MTESSATPDTATATTEQPARIFVVYTNANPGGPHNRLLKLEVDHVDPEAHAMQAPPRADWFEYFVPSTTLPGGMTPLAGTPMYFLDTVPVQLGDCTYVALRSSTGYAPFYPEQPDRNAVISSR
jgi:hypothetical protein